MHLVTKTEQNDAHDSCNCIPQVITFNAPLIRSRHMAL